MNNWYRLNLDRVSSELSVFPIKQIVQLKRKLVYKYSTKFHKLAFACTVKG